MFLQHGYEKFEQDKSHVEKFHAVFKNLIDGHGDDEVIPQVRKSV